MASHSTPYQAPTYRAHPQAVQPVAGYVGVKSPQTLARVDNGQAPHLTPGEAATAGGGISAGAPSDAQVRAQLARLQAAIKRYKLYELNFSGNLLNPANLPRGQWYTSIASFYDDFGQPVACGGVLGVSELGVANKTLPCGTKVIFYYGGRAIEVPVIDRGPYIAGREWDLTAATAYALNFPGLGPIEWTLA